MSRKNKGSKAAKTVQILAIKSGGYEYHIRFNKKKKTSKPGQGQNVKTSLVFNKYNPKTRKHEKFVGKPK